MSPPLYTQVGTCWFTRLPSYPPRTLTLDPQPPRLTTPVPLTHNPLDPQQQQNIFYSIGWYFYFK